MNVFIKSTAQSNACMDSVMTGKGRTKSKFIKRLFTVLLILLGMGNSAWGATKSNSWSGASEWDGFTKSNCETYFSHPYGMKKKDAYIMNKSISDFSTSNVTSIKIGVKSLCNGATTSVLTVFLVNSSGTTIGSGMTITPVNASAASATTWQYVTFTTNLSGVTGFKVQCTTFGKNVLVNGASYEITYTPTVTKYTVTLLDEDLATLSTLTQTVEGGSVTLPSRSNVGAWTFAGWSTSDAGISETTSFSGTIIPAGSYSPTSNLTFKPVYSRVVSGAVSEQMLYSYDPQFVGHRSGTYTEVNNSTSSYLLLGENAYVFSDAFDLSTLTRVVLQAGTYGTISDSSKKRLDIGDGTTVWNSVTLNTNKESTSYTISTGTTLTGTNSLRVISPVGDASSNGIRLKSVAIYGNVPSTTTYYIRKPTTGSLTPSDLTVTSPLAVTVGSTASISYTTSSSGTMTFTSNNTDIATVSPSGVVTGVAAGTTTISVSQVADATYAAGSQTVTVNVSAASASDGDYIKVTSAPSNWAGTYLIVYEDGSKAFDGGLTTLDAASNGIDVTIVSGNKIEANAANDAASFNISSDGDGGWAILSRSGKYIGQTANGNGLRTSTSIISNSLSLSGTDAVISCEYTTLRYNYAANQERFRYYVSGQQPVALYKRNVPLKSATIISFGDAEKILTVGQHWTNAIETNNTTGAKTYSSSNSSVASIDAETGEITAVVAGGPITITVNIAETSTHTAASATFTVTVVASNVRYYRPVTNTIELDAGILAGKRFILATPYNGTYYAMGAINASNWAASVAVPIEEREVTYLKVNEDLTGSINEFTLTKHSDAYSFQQSLDDTYLSHTYVNESTHKIYSSETNAEDNQKFSLTYINGAWAIVNKGTPNWYLQYNTSSPRFCCYINSQVNPMIFMEGLAVAAIGDDFAPDGVWTGENETLSVTTTPAAGYSSEDYTVTWIASNSNITITDAGVGTFTGAAAGELDVTILITPTIATTYSPIAKTFPMIVTGTITDRMVTLFHESFGDNSGDARDWDDSYSVKSGVEYVYSNVGAYTINNAKQGMNTKGFLASGLSQSTMGTDAFIIIGPLNVSGYTNLKVDYQWMAASVKGTYSTSLSYSTTGASGSYSEVSGTGVGTVGYTKRSYSLPVAAQVSTLYLKIVFNTSNTQALIDEVNLSGFASTYGFKVYEGSSDYSMLLVPKISPTFPTLKNNEIAVVDGLTDEQKTAMPGNFKQATNVVVNGTAHHLKVQDKVDGVYSPFYAPALLTEATKVSYARTAKEWNSVCLPFSLPFEKVTSLFGSGAVIYQLTAVDANCQVVFTPFESGTIDAGTPVLVKSKIPSGETTISWNANELAGPFSVKGEAPINFTPVGSSTVGTAELLGSYSEIVPGSVDGSQLYKLMTTTSGQCFGKLSSTGKVYPFRIYLKYTPPAASPAPANLPVKIHVIEGMMGDLNKDKAATLSDLTMMINMVNGQEEKTSAADLNGDGEVDSVDVNRLAKILTDKK